MIPDTVNGQPLHALAVHATVVLIPLTGLLGVLFAVPRLRRWAAVPLVLVAVAAAGSTYVTVQSGERLLDVGGLGAAGLGGPVADIVEQHEDLAKQLLWLVLAYAVVAVATVYLAARSDPDLLPRLRGTGARDDRGGPDRGTLPASRASTSTARVRTTVAVLSGLLVVGAVAMGVQTYRVGDLGAQAVWNPTGTVDYSD